MLSPLFWELRALGFGSHQAMSFTWACLMALSPEIASKLTSRQTVIDIELSSPHLWKRSDCYEDSS